MTVDGCSSWKRRHGIGSLTRMVSRFGGERWARYLRFRELLRHDATARQTYEDAKLQLAERFPDGREGYTAGKGPTVRQLLAPDK
jgi:GrpB-like predicted nucleotidyltransferase (UPF0157 family)